MEAEQASRILRMLPYLKYRNANGAHIYLRPTGESAYTLLDDLDRTTLERLEAEGYAPAAVVETSPDSFQAWLRHEQPLPKGLGTIAAKTLAEQFGADRSAADWRRFGRAPGFTNRKPQHRSVLGFYPFARLHSYTGQTFTAAAAFHTRIVDIRRIVEEERTAIRRSLATRPLRFLAPVSLARFRTSQRYLDRQPQRTWRFASPRVRKAGRHLISPPSYRVATFPVTRTAAVKRPTSIAPSPKPYVGQPDARTRARALRAAGRSLGGFSLHPHPPFPASARRLRARSQVPPSGLSPRSRSDNNGVSREFRTAQHHLRL